MNTRTLIVIAAVALFALGGYFLLSNSAAAPTPEASLPTTEVSSEEQPSADTEYASLVTYTDGGFSPESIAVRVGDTVRFLNNSSRGMWVGADEHPTHTQYDGTSTREHCANGTATGGSFDMCRQGAPGEFFEYTFTKAGSFDYHNHAQASDGGTVTVTE